MPRVREALTNSLNHSVQRLPKAGSVVKFGRKERHEDAAHKGMGVVDVRKARDNGLGQCITRISLTRDVINPSKVSYIIFNEESVELGGVRSFEGSPETLGMHDLCVTALALAITSRRLANEQSRLQDESRQGATLQHS